jgi:hypothetical protein
MVYGNKEKSSEEGRKEEIKSLQRWHIIFLGWRRNSPASPFAVFTNIKLYSEKKFK